MRNYKEIVVKKTTIVIKQIAGILDSLVVRIPACHAGGRGSIPRRGGQAILKLLTILKYNKMKMTKLGQFKIYLPPYV